MKFGSNSVDSGSMDFLGGAVEGQSESIEVDLFSQVFHRQRAASSQINAKEIKLKLLYKKQSKLGCYLCFSTYY